MNRHTYTQNVFDKYISKHGLSLKEELLSMPCPDLIVCVPSYDEPDLLNCLNSLYNSVDTKYFTLVILVINAPEHAAHTALQQNEKNRIEAQAFFQMKESPGFRGLVISTTIRKKHAGPGMARKIAMDQAIQLYHKYQKHKGLIASLDADTLVQANYIDIIISNFRNRKLQAASIYFEHPTEGDKLSGDLVQAITIYEVYLRYFIEALRQINYPYAYHTIGSAFAVDAETYVKHGGMNRKNAGEDFYFLHKIMPHVHYGDISDTCVYPASRFSARIPFGTGPAIRKIIQNQFQFQTYAPESFLMIQSLLQHHSVFFKAKTSLQKQEALAALPLALQNYLHQQDFTQSLQRLQKLSSHQAETFKKHYLSLWGGLKIIQVLNYLTTYHIPEQTLQVAGSQILGCKLDYVHLLQVLREKQRHETSTHN